MFTTPLHPLSTGSTITPALLAKCHVRGECPYRACLRCKDHVRIAQMPFLTRRAHRARLFRACLLSPWAARPTAHLQPLRVPRPPWTLRVRCFFSLVACTPVAGVPEVARSVRKRVRWRQQYGTRGRQHVKSQTAGGGVGARGGGGAGAGGEESRDQRQACLQGQGGGGQND